MKNLDDLQDLPSPRGGVSLLVGGSVSALKGLYEPWSLEEGMAGAGLLSVQIPLSVTSCGVLPCQDPAEYLLSIRTLIVYIRGGCKN